MQGLDLARLQVGVDYRVSSRLSIAGTVGASWTEFLSEKRAGATRCSTIDDRGFSALFAGLSGRVDLLGRLSTPR